MGQGGLNLSLRITLKNNKPGWVYAACGSIGGGFAVAPQTPFADAFYTKLYFKSVAARRHNNYSLFTFHCLWGFAPQIPVCCRDTFVKSEKKSKKGFNFKNM